MSDVIIVGASNFSSLMRKYIERFTDDNVVCFTVNRRYVGTGEFCELPVVAYEELGENYNLEKTFILISIGYKQMNSLRSFFLEDCKKKGYRLYSFIHPTAIVYADEIGDGNIILENVIIGMNTKIGDANFFWGGANISHDNIIGNCNYFSPSCVTGGCVTVNDNCFLGLNATIKSGTRIGSNTLIGAGAYLSHDSEPYSVYVPGQRVPLDKKNSLDML